MYRAARFFSNQLKQQAVIKRAISTHPTFSAGFKQVDLVTPKVSANFLLSCLGISSMVGMVSAVAYINYKVNIEPRERDILAEIKMPPFLTPIQDPEIHDFSASKDMDHGSLHNEMVDFEDEQGIIHFLKKGAQSREKLIREYMVASALHAIDPDVQPDSEIVMEPTDSPGIGQFYTLSEIKTASRDLEDFLLKEDWKMCLQQKPIKRVGATLSKVALIASQQDCKLANLVIVDMGEHYEISVIDHELSGKRFLSFNQQFATTDAHRLISMIHDDKDPQFMLYGTENLKAFLSYLRDQIFVEDIIEFHRSVQSTSFDDCIAALEAKSKVSTLVNQSDIKAWKKEFTAWKNISQDFLEQYEYDSMNPMSSIMT